MIADPLHERPVLVRPRHGKVHCHAVDGHFYPGATSTDNAMAVGYASCPDTALSGMSTSRHYRPTDGVQARLSEQAGSAMTVFCVHTTQHLLERRLQKGSAQVRDKDKRRGL